MQVVKPTSDTYVEAELLAKKGGLIAHHLQRVRDHERNRTEMLSSHFFVILISYANSTLLTLQTSISSSPSSFLVLENI